MKFRPTTSPIIAPAGHAIPLLVGLYLLAGQSGTTWRDPSPHQVRFVTVDSSVRLEVLDWGGTGRPILFVVGTPTQVTFPEAERRQLAERPIDPVIRKAIVEDNNVRPDYARIRVPVLAIYRTTTLEQALKDYPPRNDQERAAFNQGFQSARAMLAKWQRDLLDGVPAAWIVELPGANLYMFLSNEADILREVRAFAATLPQ